MPYIKQNRRTEISESPELGNFSECGSLVENVGELNWVITLICHNYILAKETYLSKGKTYSVLNEVVGALECAKLELYRTIAAPYEDKKRQENGNISELDGKYEYGE